MPKQPIVPPRPQPAEPAEPPVKDPQPYKDPVSPPPADPQEDRPLRDPLPPDSDKPRLKSMALARHRVRIISEGPLAQVWSVNAAKSFSLGAH
jgi:hypothetical protein